MGRVQRRLRGVEDGHQFPVGKLRRAEVAHGAGTGGVELERCALGLAVILAQPRFDDELRYGCGRLCASYDRVSLAAM